MTDPDGSPGPRRRRRLLYLAGLMLLLVVAALVIRSQITPAQRPADVLLESSGGGVGRTPAFTASGPFTLTYQFECSTAIGRGGFGTTGSFEATIRDPAGADAFEGRGVFDQGSAGTNSHVYPTGGRFYIDIGSECDWHVSVVKGAHPPRTPAG